MASPLNDPQLEVLLDRLHAHSDTQVDETNAYFEQREQEVSIDDENFYDQETVRFLSDEIVARDREKMEFCYLLCRSLRGALWKQALRSGSRSSPDSPILR